MGKPFRNTVVRIFNFLLFSGLAALCGFGLYGELPKLFNVFQFTSWTLIILTVILALTFDPAKQIGHVKHKGGYPVHPMFYSLQIVAIICMVASTSHYLLGVGWLVVLFAFLSMRMKMVQDWDLYKAKAMKA